MKLVIGNQKAYLNIMEANNFYEGFKDVFANNVIVCPSSIYINQYTKLNVKIGGQDVCADNEGKRTGEITARQLFDLNINYCIVGHSERREYQHETSELINRKILQLLEHQIVPILCVGESYEEKNREISKEVLIKELEDALVGLNEEQVSKLIIAYEPIWAISNGITPSSIPTNNEISDIVMTIKTWILNKYKTNNKVIYGGSVNPKNIDELNLIDCTDGYLVGGASLKAEEFKILVDHCE